MKTVTFNPSQLHTLKCALQIASAQYVQDAATMRAAGMLPLVDQFMRQHDQAETLISIIEKE